VKEQVAADSQKQIRTLDPQCHGLFATGGHVASSYADQSFNQNAEFMLAEL